MICGLRLELPLLFLEIPKLVCLLLFLTQVIQRAALLASPFPCTLLIPTLSRMML